MFSSRLPSTTSLRAFESAARHLTCTGAADELCISQSAVSKQLRALEETLGVTLFGRTTQGLALTSAGEQYLNTARTVLARLELATAEFAAQTPRRQSLRLQVLQTLADKWLMPRLMTFVQQNPGVDIQFADTASFGCRSAQPDAAFRFGTDDWPDQYAHYLFGNDVALVCAPSLLDLLGDAPCERAFDTLRHLEHSQAASHWIQFRAQHGFSASGPMPQLIRYGYYSLIIQSAVAGLGLALVPRCLVHSELTSGQLKNPFSLSISSQLGYYLVQSRTASGSAVFSRFLDWALIEAAATNLKQYHKD